VSINSKHTKQTTNNNKQQQTTHTMASKAFTTMVMNGFNDAIRTTLSDVLKRMNEAESVSDCRDIVEKMLSDVKTIKKADKVKKPRYSGYHIFMREYRAVVKAEQPDLSPQELTSVVAKSWKNVSDDEKAEYNNRAAQMKAEAESSASDSDSSQSDSPKKETKPKNEKETKPKNEKETKSKPKKETKPKKDTKPKKETKSKQKTTKSDSDNDSNNKTTYADEIDVEIMSDEDI
jgi:hypothetical protein